MNLSHNCERCGQSPVLLYSQIDKAAKCRYVVDDAVQLKSGLQVMYILDAVVKLHHLDRCTRVASGFSSSRNMSDNVGNPTCLVM